MCVKILIILLLFGVQLYSGKDIAKIEFDNGKEVYEIRELQNKSVEFINPKKDIPVLREILFYKVIEKPYIQETYDQEQIIEKSKDEQEKQEPVFDETRRPFTNSQGFQFLNWGYQDENNDNNLAESDKHKDVDDNDDKDDAGRNKNDNGNDKFDDNYSNDSANDKDDADRNKNDNDNDKFDDNYSNDSDNDKNDTTYDKKDDMSDDDTEDSNKKQLNDNNENIKTYDNQTDDNQNGNNTNANEENNDRDGDNIGKTNITKENVNDEKTKEDKIPEEDINLVKKLREQLLNSTKEKYHNVQRIHKTEKHERRKREVNYRNIPEAPILPDLDVKSFPSYIQRMLANRPVFDNDERSKTKNDYDTSLFNKMSGMFPPNNTASDKAKTYGFKYNQGQSTSWNDIHKTENHHKSNVPNVLDLSGSQTNNPYEVQKPTIDIRDNIIPKEDERLSKNKEGNYESPKNMIPSLDINFPAEKDHDIIKKNTESEKQSNTDLNNKENVNTNYIDNSFGIKDRLIDMLHNIDSKLSNGKKPKTYGMSLKGDKGEIWNDLAGVPSTNIDNTHNEDVLEKESINNPNQISNLDDEKEDNVDDNKDYNERNPNIFESNNEPNKINTFDDAREVINSFNDDNKKELDNYEKSNSDKQIAPTHEVNNAEKTPYEDNLFNVPHPAPKLPDFNINKQFITSTNKPKVGHNQINEIVQHTTGIPNVPYFTQTSTEKTIEVTKKPKLEESKVEKEHRPIDNESLRRKMEESFDNIIKQFPKLEPIKEEDVDVSKKIDVTNNNNKPRTYGMHLEGDHGYVWNDLTNPGTHVNVGDLENIKVTEPNVDEVIPNSDMEKNYSEPPIQTTTIEYEKKTETTTNKNDEEITEEPTTTTTKRVNVTEGKNNGMGETTEKSKDNGLDDKKDCTCKNDTLIKEKVESVNNNNETKPIKDTLDNLLKKDEFWQWLSNWTTTYMDVLNERVGKLVEDKIAERFDNNDKNNNNHEVDQDNKNNKNNDTAKIGKGTDDNEDDDSSKKTNIDKHNTNNNNTKINNDDIEKSNITDIESGKDIKNDNGTGTTTEKSNPEIITKDNINSTDDDMSRKKNNTLPFNIKADTIYGNAIDSDHVTNIFIFYPDVKLNKTVDQLEPLINKTNTDISVKEKPVNITFDARIGIPEDDKDNQINKPNTSTDISSSTQSNKETTIDLTSTTESITTTEKLAKNTPKDIEESKNENNPKPSNDQNTEKSNKNSLADTDLKEPAKVTEKVKNDNQVTTETPKSDHNETTTDATNTENIKETTKLSDKEATTESIKTESEKETTKLNSTETTTESSKTGNDKETTKPDDNKTTTPSSDNNDNNVTTTDKSEITTESSTDKPSDSDTTEKPKDSKDTSDVTTKKSAGS